MNDESWMYNATLCAPPLASNGGSNSQCIEVPDSLMGGDNLIDAPLEVPIVWRKGRKEGVVNGGETVLLEPQPRQCQLTSLLCIPSWLCGEE